MKQSIVPVILVLLVCLGGSGLYGGWRNLSRRSPSANHGTSKQNVDLTVDREKFDEDVQTVTQKTARLISLEPTSKPSTDY